MAGTDLFERLAHAFVDGYNARDPEAWPAIFHSEGTYHPTILVGDRSAYTGPDRLREYIEILRADDRGQLVRVREVRPCSDEVFVMCAEVLMDGEFVTDSTVIFQVRDELIFDGKAYLTDDQTLERLAMLPPGCGRALDESGAGQPGSPPGEESPEQD